MALNQQGTITTGGGNGYAGGFSFDMTQDGVFNYTIVGNDTFNVYIVTGDNYDRFSHNESFGYIEDVSVVNVTHAIVNGNLPAGNYSLMIWCHGQNSVTILGTGEAYPSTSLSIPWNIMGIVLATALITVLLTYSIMKTVGRKNK